ncbi:hypothetical protein HYPSUDRAFT_63603 [Hypholoma sublateritium FD-334 SS-4]|uniref:Uncharacterized protein n=1 Tax=Hypholoma sublateritium (strain FD-334 SS-4) TaxID=945553 RepID=A0A0D2LGR2_HYPSF|nr:hypothetical protein HYPSUDRAFT_63603 [Hypholoma sublateritium FD-334 SS-4]
MSELCRVPYTEYHEAGPPVRTAQPSASRRRRDDLINAYEAEEERIINVLSRKLEQLREDKIDLENALEAESEAHVNRLARELTALRAANGELQAQLARVASAQGGGVSHDGRGRVTGGASEPGSGLLLDALQRENAGLRARLAAVEGDYARVRRLNEVYREELIAHRSRHGLSVDSLIGLTSADRDPFAHPTHHRPPSTTTTTTMAAAGPSNGVPIPRPASQVHRPASPPRSLSTSPSSAALSPLYPASSPADSFLHRRYSSSASGATPASFVSVSTNITSPPSSAGAAAAAAAFVVHGLSYPSVPPPSLSSSFGSPSPAWVGRAPRQRGRGRAARRRDGQSAPRG